MIQSCAAIVIAAKHGELIKVKDASGIAHTVGTLRCKFDFRTNDWDYTTRTAVFCKGNVSTHPKVVDTAIGVVLDGIDECAVPPEVLLPDEKYFSVGVWGVTNDGLRIVSEWLVFRIKDGCYVSSTESFLPTPSVYEQILISLDLKAPIDHKHEEYVTEQELTDKNYATETFVTDAVDKLIVANRPVSATTITLLADAWIGDASPYSQVVKVSNVTATSRIDLQPTPTQLASLQDNETSLIAENNNKVVTVYAVGEAPNTDYEIQITITEVLANE